ncbi:MAG: UvrD-helicase domain-containing protein, partial [Candidatus Omnitrophica bacterium]|nr:UvrD-helicase domain-containing protein [Candidatus Omnitrophota bacterium]
MDKILEGLNREQLEAVTYGEGPLLIIAGAGTGKTNVITRRIAYLISKGLAKQQEILALTFTDKAAQEMEERVDILVPYGYTDIWISTFHAFGDRVLRENAFILGLDPDFKVLTHAESIVFLREHLFEFDLSFYRPLSEPTRYLDPLISIFSRLRDEDISPQEYLEYASKLVAETKQNLHDKAKEEEAFKTLEIAKAYAKYLELLNREGKVDFANQFYLTLQLFRNHPSVLKYYQEKFKYILIDEFQDTNYAQYQLAKLLCGDKRNITVVADDDQCIYRWRGAAYSNVLNFMQDFPEAKKISLIINYRSGQQILDSAYRLIQYNNPERFEIKAGINKRLVALKESTSPFYLHFDNYLAEADFVAKTIKEKVESNKFKFSDFAILVRSNSDAQVYLEALNMLGVPWRFSGNQGLYQRPEVMLCINFLRTIADITNSLSLYYLISSEVYRIDMEDLILCMHYAKRHNRYLYWVFKHIHEIEELKELKGSSYSILEKFLKEIEKFLELSRQQNTGRLLYSFLKESGYLSNLVNNPTEENEYKIQNIARFFNLVRDFESVTKENRVNNFINYLDLLIEAGEDPATVEADPDADAVNVLTVHKAKGLEFRVVFLVSLVQGRFPWPHRKQIIEIPDELIKDILPTGDYHIQEERRLFYVAMTRAKEELYLSWASDYGGLKSRKVSQFVVEALGEEILNKEKKKISSLELISGFSQPLSVQKVSKRFPQDQLLTLSYLQIDDYLSCPLKYKYVHILRIPIMEHHAVIYGRAMHEAVSKYLRYKLAGRKVNPDFILEAFKEAFIPVGFLGKQHQEERERIAKEALLRFYYEQEKEPKPPTYVEKDFSFIYENNRIIGRFDRIDIEEDGAIITDFKSSQVNKQQ